MFRKLSIISTSHDMTKQTLAETKFKDNQSEELLSKIPVNQKGKKRLMNGTAKPTSAKVKNYN